MYNEEFASVEGVMQAIKTCRGFGQNWDNWLEARKSEGWIVTNLTFSENPSAESPNYSKGVRLEFGRIMILANLGESSHGYVGKSGRCDVLIKVRSYQDAQVISKNVRNKMNRIRPDWNGITYFSSTEKLSFNEEKRIETGKPITFFVQVYFDNARFVMPK